MLQEIAIKRSVSEYKPVRHGLDLAYIYNMKWKENIKCDIQYAINCVKVIYVK